ncbi:MAG TPA: hypothetical protein VIC55_00735 [Gemmatimonadaceae bacterium]
MKTHVVRRATARPADLTGRILARDVRGADGARRFAKGQVIGAADATELLAIDWMELHVIEPEPGEMHEDEAGRRIAAACAGTATSVGAFAAGARPIAATQRGILRVDVERLDRVNMVDGACIYTLYDGQLVEPGEVVARAKITPFVIDASRVETVEHIARESGGLLSVRGFRPVTVAAVVQETLAESAQGRFRTALQEKIAWFGAVFAEPRFVPVNGTAVATAIEDAIADGAEVVVMAGTKALDPLDAAFVALERLGARLERFGAPAHPGSLLWLACLRDVPILGMPSCGLFSQATSFDLVLPRILAGEPVGRESLGALGHGGLLSRDYAFRFPRYRAGAARGELA